jgi:hypothetical protein
MHGICKGILPGEIFQRGSHPEDRASEQRDDIKLHREAGSGLAEVTLRE